MTRVFNTTPILIGPDPSINERSVRKKTVLRTIRLLEPLDEIVQMEAKEKGLSPNALLSSVITKYAEWDRFAERYGFVSLSKEFLRSTFGLTDATKIAEESAAKVSQELKNQVDFFFDEVNLSNFVLMLSMWAKYGRLFALSTKKERDAVFIMLHHDFGYEYSRLFSLAIDEILRKEFKSRAEIDASDTTVTIKFSSLPQVQHH